MLKVIRKKRIGFNIAENKAKYTLLFVRHLELEKYRFEKVMGFKCPRVNLNENINRLNIATNKCFTSLTPLFDPAYFRGKLQ